MSAQMLRKKTGENVVPASCRIADHHADRLAAIEITDVGGMRGRHGESNRNGGNSCLRAAYRLVHDMAHGAFSSARRIGVSWGALGRNLGRDFAPFRNTRLVFRR